MEPIHMAVSTSMSEVVATDDYVWKPQKRIPERDSDVECYEISDKCVESSNNIKRFRPATCNKTCIKSPNDVSSFMIRKSIYDHFQDNAMSALSPITEISMNMSDTNLEKSNSVDIYTGGLEDGPALNGTPLKGWSNAVHSNTYDYSRFLNRKLNNNTWNETTAISKNHNDDKTSFQMTRSNPVATRGARRLNMDASLHEMAVDELSFYDDESAETRSFTASPPLMGLLSPEGSPQRFKIVKKSDTAANAKFLQPSSRHLKHNINAVSNTSSSNTPAKSFRMFHSLSSGSMESSMDDEYMELFEMESLESESHTHLNFPSDLNSLISGQIKSASPACSSSSLLSKTPEMRRPSVRRCLSMTENQQQQQQKTPETMKPTLDNITPFASRMTAERTSYCFKRPEPPSTNCSPVQSKRYRGEEKENLNGSYISASPVSSAAPTTTTRITLRKCMSMNDAEIMTALARSDCTDQPDLIGDFSKPYALPLMDGRHRDLKSVSSDTVARLLNGEFDEQVASYRIIDCRYPYEFEGGHIRGAKNLYTQEEIIDEFLTQQKTEQHQARNEGSAGKRNIVIFHCEFSSERGPKLSRFLRNNDRARNTNAYPALDYPEVYLLHNGYKEFYETHAELCDPIAYRPMLEPAYGDAYRHFRAKSKSWNGDGLGGATTRLKKSRSRLLL